MTDAISELERAVDQLAEAVRLLEIVTSQRDKAIELAQQLIQQNERLANQLTSNRRN